VNSGLVALSLRGARGPRTATGGHQVVEQRRQVEWLLSGERAVGGANAT